MSDKLDEEYELSIWEEAWDYLQRENLAFALKVEKMVRAGKTPEQLSRMFIATAGEHRGPRARRIENASRYLQAIQEGK